MVSAFAKMETHLLMDHAQLHVFQQQQQLHHHQLLSKEIDVHSRQRMIAPTERESTNAQASTTVLHNKLAKQITLFVQIQMNIVLLMTGRAHLDNHSVNYTHVFLRNIVEFKMPSIQVTIVMEQSMSTIQASHVLVMLQLQLQLQQTIAQLQLAKLINS